MASESKKPSWMQIGAASTTPTKDKKRVEVKVDDYYMVVGFEVNNPDAFKPATVVNGKYIPDAIKTGDVTTMVHDLAVDYGHAFFYVVKNNLVELVFSFGPAGAGKVSTWNPIQDGYKNARPGTPDYQIVEAVSAFKISLTLQQGMAIVKKTVASREEIIKGDKKYTVYKNDTCAEEARDLLVAASIENPSGSGWIKHSDISSWPLVRAVNPYMWHHQFKKAGKYPSAGPTSLPAAAQSNPSALVGQSDPLF